ncbi:MAG: amino acid adenylation domain-containing protein [Gammaproteobacteria bacterium]
MARGMEHRAAPAGGTGRSLPRIVERWARERPDAPAVSGIGGSLDYAGLNRRANRIAACLVARGVGQGSLVGLALPRGSDLVAALLGILKAGAAYVPLDPDHPPRRLRRVLGRVAMPLLVTESALLPALGSGLPTLCLDRDVGDIDGASAADPAVPLAAADPCYVMFTSGSTGEPKGVVVTHGNVARLFDHLGPQLGLGAADTWSQLHSCAFGFSVFEIWGALCHGARLALAPAQARADALALRDFLRREGVTVLSQTPSAFRETVLGPVFAGQWPSLAVRLLVLSGEAVQVHDLRRWSAAQASGAPRLVNSYAITETGGNVMLREYAAGDDDARNIGLPLPDVPVHILDAAGVAVPDGEPGELHVGGPGIAAGYLDDAALTASRFIDSGPQAGRLYRSGDRVRRAADGSLEFLGRMDEQVKWRGHRLELGEIESLLRTHPGVSAAAAAIRADGSGEEKLVAYVVPGGGAGAAREPEFWPSLGGYQVYDDFLYGLMGSDAVRNAALRTAFERHAADRVVLDLGTGPQALLARMAAQAGARHVYAVELLPAAAEQARAAVAAAGLAGRITVVTGDAATLQLPEAAEVCAQGIIGNIGSADGIAAIWNRVRSQFAAGAVAIPSRCTTLIAPVELPAALRASPRLAPLALDYVRRIFAAEGRAFDLRLCLRNLPPGQLLAPPRVFEDLDFAGALPEAHAGGARFELARAGHFDGFLLWTVVTTTPGCVIDYLEHQHAWLPVFMPLPVDGPALPAGAVIEAGWQWQAGRDGLFPDYQLESRYSIGGRNEHHRYLTRHHETARGGTALHRRLLELPEAAVDRVAPGDLRAWLARHLPEPLLPNAWMYLDALPLNTSGKLDRRALPAPAERSWGGQGGAPQTALESDLATLWSEILGVAAVGLQDNFFDLGGDSIAAVRLTTQLQQLLDADVMLAAIFEAPTLAALARYLGERHAAAVSTRYGTVRSRSPAQQAGMPRQHDEP